MPDRRPSRGQSALVVAGRLLLLLVEVLLGILLDVLDGHVEHAGEYVNVYHSADYVRATWGRYFDVAHVLPGYILHHDLVMLRKP